jgi:hypothetical protein
MRCLAAVAFALAATLPLCAQRGGGMGHAGFAAHGAPAARSAPAFRGSFAPPSSFHYSGTAHAPMFYSPRPAGSGFGYGVRPPINRPIFYPNRTHNFIIRNPRYGFGYYPSFIYLPYGGFYDDWSDNYDNYDIGQQSAPDYSYLQPDYGYPAPDYGYPQPDDGYAYPQPAPEPDYGYAYPQPVPAYPAYPQSAPVPPYGYPEAVPPGYQVYVPAPSAPQMQYVPGSSDTVILIYKDGRPPEQIQNYLATRSTLTILDGGRRRTVPLSDLDLTATIRANRQTGVDFRLPTATP